MIIDWNEYEKQIQQQIAEIGRSNREIIKGYRQLANSGNASNLLGKKVRELIALAVAVTGSAMVALSHTPMQPLSMVQQRKK
jgi:hypothetical protein